MTEFTIHTLETAPEQSRPLLEDSKKSFGRVPGLHAVMAEAPALLDGYKHLHRLFQHETSFDKDELTVVWQTINVEHACHYCVPAHTGIAKMMKVDDAISNALRDETALPSARLEALRDFTLAVVRKRGNISDADVRAFLLRLFDLGIHEHGTARTQIHGLRGFHRGLGKAAHFGAHRGGKGL